MNSRKSIRVLLYLALLLGGILLFYLAFRKIPVAELREEIATVRTPWLLALLLPSWGGQFLRAWRWHLLLGKEAKYRDVYHALLFGYFVNLGLPRVGEVSRCAALQSLGGVRFAKTLGTVVMERATDLVFLALVVALAFGIQQEELREFLRSGMFAPLLSLVEKWFWWIVVAGVLGVVGLIFLFKRAMASGTSRLARLFLDWVEGLRSLFRLPASRLVLFGILSAAIWSCYFFTTWFWFFALPSANGASLSLAFTLMAVGSIVKSIPIQGGGMGAYHYVIGGLLNFYGMASVSSATFALLNHGYQTLFYLIFGGASAIWIILKKNR